MMIKRMIIIGVTLAILNDLPTFNYYTNYRFENEEVIVTITINYYSIYSSYL